MNIAVAVKVVPDDQDIAVAADRTLDYSKAHQVVSEYDLNAIEAAALLAEDAGATLYAVSASNAKADDLKVKKSILSRGPAELCMIADDAFAFADARVTARALATLVRGIGEVDLVVCGDGSADMYAGQVDVQLADALGLPVVTAVSAVSVEGAVATCDRMLETQLQTVQVDLPAVISVVPDIALPRIPGMKDILAAGKKPMNVAGADGAYESSIEVASCLAPKQADRKREILEASADGAIEQFQGHWLDGVVNAILKK